MNEQQRADRVRARELAAEFAEQGDITGWFEALYRESDGDPDLVPWVDMEPNRFFRRWAESKNLRGDGRSALVVGCGTGDDAKYLCDLGFKVTAFDISPTAIEWAKRLHGRTDIQFEVMDLFKPYPQWLGAFEFVLEIYTIQPLPIEVRPRVIEAIAAFVRQNGELVVVTHARGNDEETDEVPWPLSRRDLLRFEDKGLALIDLQEIWDEEDEKLRFIAEYRRGV